MGSATHLLDDKEMVKCNKTYISDGTNNHVNVFILSCFFLKGKSIPRNLRAFKNISFYHFEQITKQ